MANSRSLRRLVSTCFVGLAAVSQSTLVSAEPFAAALQRGSLTVGFSNEPPFAYEANGVLVGEAPAVLEAIIQDHKIPKIEGVLTDFSALIPGLKSGRFDVIGAGMYIRPARCAEVAFGNPDIAVGEALIVRAGNPKNITSYADIAKGEGITIGVGRGGVEAELAPLAGIPQDRIVTFADLTTLVSGLAAGRVDAVGVPDVSVGDLIAKVSGGGIEKVVMSEQPLDQNGKPAVGYGAAAFQLSATEDVAAYNEGLAQLRASGKLLEILNKSGFSESNLPPEGLTAKQVCDSQ